MKDLMFWGMFIACLIISAMTIYIMYSQALVNRDLERKYQDLKNEFLHVFGWDQYEWAKNFRDYARRVEELIKFKKEIERLEIIKKASEAQSLEDLQKKKEQIESVIRTLQKH
jgi:ethanolamine utilization cobalamin adenosyltransferase